MKIWKIAALLALATIPLILLGSNNNRKKGSDLIQGETDNIFESELTAD
jgi:hypothetical protein